jgi:GDPmannose 4,6-dehydratase
MVKKAFITGITGQDGSWLAKLLLDKGYDVYGGVRRISKQNLTGLNFLGIADKVTLVEFDLLDYSNIYTVIADIKPDEFYNLAAQSFVGTSFKQPVSTGMMDGIAVTYILDIIKTFSPHTKFYQASTSEMFGKVQMPVQNETTPFYPRSPYGVAKLYAHWMTINYRESYNLFASSGILFNHESELRGPEFVTRKVTMNVAKWATGHGELLQIGNLDAQRDWGYAKEYVEGMWKMLQSDTPDTFVLATGKTTSIREFITSAFCVIDINLEWQGSHDEEFATNTKTGEVVVKVNPDFYRPAEVELLVGDSTKAQNMLGWTPSTDIARLTEIMVRHDIDILAR